MDFGYINKPERTKSVFLDNPFGEGKIYKSGDIGRWTFDGKLQILGRVDHQIKLRGLRIELGEIENKIAQIDGVTSSVVNKIELDGKEVLCGYYVSNKDVLEKDVRDTLRKSLPPYMVPSFIIRLSEMPYTINRKIDRKSLPKPKQNNASSINSINRNSDMNEISSTEEQLLQIWRDILKVNNISLDDNFFDIGGDSIAAINVQIEAVKYGLNFEYADIFNYPTIRKLSKKLPLTEDNFIENYDYSRVNKVLERNSIQNFKTISKIDVGNILLVRSYWISWFSYCL